MSSSDAPAFKKREGNDFVKPRYCRIGKHFITGSSSRFPIDEEIEKGLTRHQRENPWVCGKHRQQVLAARKVSDTQSIKATLSSICILHYRGVFDVPLLGHTPFPLVTKNILIFVPPPFQAPSSPKRALCDNKTTKNKPHAIRVEVTNTQL